MTSHKKLRRSNSASFVLLPVRSSAASALMSISGSLPRGSTGVLLVLPGCEEACDLRDDS